MLNTHQWMGYNNILVVIELFLQIPSSNPIKQILVI